MAHWHNVLPGVVHDVRYEDFVADQEGQSRALIDYSLRPWLVKIEKALSGDPDLCPGGTYCEFELDALLRGDADSRSQIYARALGDITHPAWLTVDEVRALEDRPPMPATARSEAAGA